MNTSALCIIAGIGLYNNACIEEAEEEEALLLEEERRKALLAEEEEAANYVPYVYPSIEETDDILQQFIVSLSVTREVPPGSRIYTIDEDFNFVEVGQ